MERLLLDSTFGARITRQERGSITERRSHGTGLVVRGRKRSQLGAVDVEYAS
jgi:hypothetical protein